MARVAVDLPIAEDQVAGSWKQTAESILLNDTTRYNRDKVPLFTIHKKNRLKIGGRSETIFGAFWRFANRKKEVTNNDMSTT